MPAEPGRGPRLALPDQDGKIHGVWTTVAGA
jgi:hypothetical protein